MGAGQGAATGGTAPGINPELEQMLTRISALQQAGGAGKSPVPAPGVGGPGGGMPPALGAGGGLPGIAAGAPTSQGTPMAPNRPGEQQPMQPQQANMTYQALIKAGVPPQIAQQALGNPKFLQEILASISKQGGQSAIPAPQAVAGVRG